MANAFALLGRPSVRVPANPRAMGSVSAKVETNMEEGDDARVAVGEPSASSPCIFQVRRAKSMDDEMTNHAEPFCPEGSPLRRPRRPFGRGFHDPCRGCKSDDVLHNIHASNRCPEVYQHTKPESSSSSPWENCDDEGYVKRPRHREMQDPDSLLQAVTDNVAEKSDDSLACEMIPCNPSYRRTLLFAGMTER